MCLQPNVLYSLQVSVLDPLALYAPTGSSSFGAAASTDEARKNIADSGWEFCGSSGGAPYNVNFTVFPDGSCDLVCDTSFITIDLFESLRAPTPTETTASTVGGAGVFGTPLSLSMPSLFSPPSDTSGKTSNSLRQHSTEHYLSVSTDSGRSLQYIGHKGTSILGTAAGTAAGMGWQGGHYVVVSAYSGEVYAGGSLLPSPEQLQQMLGALGATPLGSAHTATSRSVSQSTQSGRGKSDKQNAQRYDGHISHKICLPRPGRYALLASGPRTASAASYRSHRHARGDGPAWSMCGETRMLTTGSHLPHTDTLSLTLES